MLTHYDAFISYGRADSKKFAIELNNRLQQNNFKIWFDQNDIPPAVDWQKQINDGIERANNFLFIMSPHSIKSKYCQVEIELAVKYNKRIIPLHHVNSDREYDLMHPILHQRNWLSWLEANDSFNFEASLTKLLATIREDADYVTQHTEYLVLALQWQKNQQQTQYLLIGEKRIKAESWLRKKFSDIKQPPCTPTDLHCQYICESTKNAHNLLTQVFICHSEKDNQVREKLVRALNRQGITSWTNKTDIKSGKEFQEEINKGIEGADNFIYLVSQNSVTCGYCREELIHALKYNKRIIPILIESFDLITIPNEIKDIQFIDCTEEDKFDELIKIIKEEANYYEKHKILLVKALRWKAQNNNRSLLLRGYNLQHFEAWLNTGLSRKSHPPLPLHTEFINASNGQTTGELLDVFISYSRADADFARKLNNRLQELGKTTWFDQESIAVGEDFKKEIEKGIESSDNFVFIISPRSVNSPYCADEVEHAFMLNKRFITILLSPVESNQLHPALARVQYIDFRKDEFYIHFNELVRVLDRDREHVRNHSKWTRRALEWEEKNRTKDLLLRGTELETARNWLKESKTKKLNPPPTQLQKTYFSRSLFQKRVNIGVIVGGVSLALLTSTSLWLQAKQQTKIAQLNQADSLARYSSSLFIRDKQIEALIEAIRAGKIAQHNKTTSIVVLKALNQAVYGIREKNRLIHRDVVNTVAFSPTNNLLVSGSGYILSNNGDNSIRLWNLEGKELNTLTGHKQRVNSVAFSFNGEMIVSGSSDRTIKLWTKEGEELKTLTGHLAEVNSVAFNPDGKIIVSGSDDKTIKLWSKEGKELKTLTGHLAEVNSVAFNPDGKIIVSGSNDQTIKLWDLDGKLLKTFKGHSAEVNSVSFNHEGDIIISGSSDKTIKLWNLDGKELGTFSHHNQPINSVVFAKNNAIASGGKDEMVTLWNLQGNELTTLSGYQNPIKDIDFSLDNQFIATASWDKPVKLWKTQTKEVKSLSGHNDFVWDIIVSDSHDAIATSSNDKTIKLWNKNGEFMRNLSGHKGSVWTVAFSKDGKSIATASSDKTAKLWNLDGKELTTLIGHKDIVFSVDFSPDNNLVATSSVDKTIKLWNRQGKLLSTFDEQEGMVMDVIFSPDGQVIASIINTDDRFAIALWNLQGKILKKWDAHNQEVRTITFSPDGKNILTSSYDKTIKLWDLKGNLIRTFIGHEDEVYNAVFNNDGTMIASASKDKTVILWNINGEIISVVSSFKDTVWSVAFSEDSQSVIASTGKNLVEIWNLNDLDLDSLIKSGCNWLKDYLKNSKDAKQSDKNLCLSQS